MDSFFSNEALATVGHHGCTSGMTHHVMRGVNRHLRRNVRSTLPRACTRNIIVFKTVKGRKTLTRVNISWSGRRWRVRSYDCATRRAMGLPIRLPAHFFCYKNEHKRNLHTRLDEDGTVHLMTPWSRFSVTLSAWFPEVCEWILAHHPSTSQSP